MRDVRLTASLYATTVCLDLLAPTNSSHAGIFLHRLTVSKGPKSKVRHSAESDQLGSKSVLSGLE